MSRTFVLGLGNVLMGDDAFGPAVVHAIEDAYRIDKEVEVVDLGTPGLDMTPWMTDADRLIIVDTVKSNRPPGTLCVYTKDDIMAQPQDRPQQRAGVGSARQVRRALAFGFRAGRVEVDDRGTDAVLDAVQGVVVAAARQPRQQFRQGIGDQFEQARGADADLPDGP